MGGEFSLERGVESSGIVEHEVMPRSGKEFETRLRRIRILFSGILFECLA